MNGVSGWGVTIAAAVTVLAVWGSLIAAVRWLAWLDRRRAGDDR